MKAAVRYYTKSGNSKKLAEAVAGTIGAEALDVSNKLREDVDVLFLCNSVYWGGVDKNVKSFLSDPGAKIGKLVNVSTAAMIDSTYAQMQKMAAECNILLSDKEFHCKGSFKFMHKGKPDSEDLKAVCEFVKTVLNGVE